MPAVRQYLPFTRRTDHALPFVAVEQIKAPVEALSACGKVCGILAEILWTIRESMLRPIRESVSRGYGNLCHKKRESMPRRGGSDFFLGRNTGEGRRNRTGQTAEAGGGDPCGFLPRPRVNQSPIRGAGPRSPPTPKQAGWDGDGRVAGTGDRCDWAGRSARSERAGEPGGTP